MPKVVTAKTRERILPPQGLHNARAYSIIDLGTQKKQYKGKDKKPAPMLNIGFELVDTEHNFNPEDENDVAPFTIHSDYTLSLTGKAKLKEMIENIHGITIKPGDEIDVYKKIKNVPCQVMVKHSEPNEKGEVYANITTFLPASGKKVAELHNEIRTLVLDSAEEFDKDVYDSLPEFIQEKIKGSKEFRENILMDEQVDKTPAKKTAAKPAAKTAAKKKK